jgi:hypothetical protein
MMNKFYKYLIVLSIVFLISKSSIAQLTGSANTSVTISEVAMMDIEPNNSAISLSLNSPTEAGLPVTNGVNSNSKWINYSSAVSFGETRTISAQISTGSVPAGTIIQLTASGISTGAGARGSSTGTISLSNSPQVIINGIGGSYTGTGTNNGHSLTYNLVIQNYSLLDNASTNVLSILFTISDN